METAMGIGIGIRAPACPCLWDGTAGVGNGAGQGTGSHAMTMGYHSVYQGLAERKQGNGAFADSIR